MINLNLLGVRRLSGGISAEAPKANSGTVFWAIRFRFWGSVDPNHSTENSHPNHVLGVLQVKPS